MDSTDNRKAALASEEEIDLRRVFRLLWRGKWLIGGVTTATAIISIVVALLLPDIYRAEALLAPNEANGSGGMSALAAQYGGLASLAGISLGEPAVDKTALGLEVLKSRRFITEFIDRREILVNLIAATGWDSVTGTVEVDAKDYDARSGKWVRKVSPPKKTVPSPQEAYEEFQKLLFIEQDMATGFVTLGIDHYSPAVAKQWVDWLVEDLNATIRRRDVSQAQQAIEYLHEQIENTSLAGLQSVFFNLIEEQTKTVMLASMTDEYLLKTLDPAVAPERKARPKRSLIVALSAFLGFLLAVILVFVKSTLQDDGVSLS